jgi:tight adherence protein B
MGALIGLLAGVGLVLVVWAFGDPEWRPRPRERRDRLRGLLARAGLSEVSPRSLAGLCTAAFVVAGLVMTAISGVAAIGLVFGLLSATLPIAVLRGRALRRLREHAELWPDAVDNLASAVRAGLSLPESLVQLGERGPEGLRDPFVQFDRDYQATGRFDESLDLLKARLADPVGDRVIEALRIARDVGGGDLGRMLRALSGFLRDDLRTRGELESRQSWTVNGARLAVVAPWAVLLAMSFQRDVVARYASPAGAVVLAIGAVFCVVAYRLMLWIGRLPTERRVLG